MGSVVERLVGRVGWRVPVLVCAVVAGLMAAPAGVGAGPSSPADTLSIVKDDFAPGNVEVAVTISEETFITADRVLIARDDAFADALASGVLQADAPLLLVPSQGPLPSVVVDQIRELAPAEAVVLGGSAAIGDAVVTELEGMDLAVQRRQGGSRFETAIDIASKDAPDAGTVMLARAFGSNPADPSQGFADTLAAGGIAARLGYPIMLTQTEVLTESTKAYLLATQAIHTVNLLGGTAAISVAVEDELRELGYVVERVAGPSRADTALEIAKLGGDVTALDADRVIVADGSGPDAWAAGFALASHAARFNAPIVLTLGSTIPPATLIFLETGIGGDPDVAPVLTCAVVPSVCEPVRVTAQLPAAQPPAVMAGSLTAGSTHTCGLDIDGAAHCWGNDQLGTLGDGPDDGANEHSPVPVDGGLTFVQLTAGNAHTCGLTTEGQAFCWGDGSGGAVGDGNDDGQDVVAPVPVAGGLTFAQLSAGYGHTCGVTTGGEGYCWGSDAQAQLGNGPVQGEDDYRAHLAPVPIEGGLTISQVTAGQNHTCGLTVDGAAHCWGQGTFGQLGDGESTSSSVPVEVVGGFTFTQLTAGDAFTCGLTGESAAYCWGFSADGRLGIGDPSGIDVSVPVQVAGGLAFVSIAAGAAHACGVTSDGSGYCWGYDGQGGIGDGPDDGVGEVSPVPVAGGLTFAQIAGGLGHTCGLTVSGAALCWGNDEDGQVGDGPDDGGVNEHAPVRVAGGLTFS